MSIENAELSDYMRTPFRIGEWISSNLRIRVQNLKKIKKWVKVRFQDFTQTFRDTKLIKQLKSDILSS